MKQENHKTQTINTIEWLKKEIEAYDYNAIESIVELRDKLDWGSQRDHLNFLEDRLTKNLQTTFLYSELKKRLETTMESE